MIYDTAKVLDRTKIEAQSDKWFIGDFCLVTVPRLVLGQGVQINAGSKLLGRDAITLGDYSVIGYDCLLMTSTDRPAIALANDFLGEEHRMIDNRDIGIGRHAFIGSKTTLMPGCWIPEGCVIQQNSVIEADDCYVLEPWTVRYRNGDRRPRPRPHL